MDLGRLAKPELGAAGVGRAMAWKKIMPGGKEKKMSGKKGGGHGPGKKKHQDAWSEDSHPQEKKIEVAKKRMSTRQQPNFRQLCAKTEAGQNEGAKPTQI